MTVLMCVEAVPPKMRGAILATVPRGKCAVRAWVRYEYSSSCASKFSMSALILAPVRGEHFLSDLNCFFRSANSPRRSLFASVTDFTRSAFPRRLACVNRRFGSKGLFARLSILERGTWGLGHGALTHDMKTSGVGARDS